MVHESLASCDIESGSARWGTCHAADPTVASCCWGQLETACCDGGQCEIDACIVGTWYSLSLTTICCRRLSLHCDASLTSGRPCQRRQCNTCARAVANYGICRHSVNEPVYFNSAPRLQHWIIPRGKIVASLVNLNLVVVVVHNGANQCDRWSNYGERNEETRNQQVWKWLFVGQIFIKSWHWQFKYLGNMSWPFTTY